MSLKLASSLHALTLHSQRFSYALNRKKQVSAIRDKSISGHLNSEALNPEACQVQALAKGKNRAERWGPATCGSIWVLKGSWDLVSRVIIRVTLLITTYNPN